MDNQENKKLEEGDVFYTFSENKYQTYKLLKIDEKNEAFHLLFYELSEEVPEIEKIKKQTIAIYHLPIDIKSLENTIFLGKTKINAHELIGYHEYFKQTNDVNNIGLLVNEYYKKGYYLSEQKEYNDAIEEYSKAIYLFPQFFQALDNRAFCKMDLYLWEEAIKDFQKSLLVNPKSFIAEFSMGECYIRLGNIVKAKEQFQKSFDIDPSNKIAQDFLKELAK